jgi:hypothetical protein
LEDGYWADWVALEGAGFLIDCMGISARIFEIRDEKDFEQIFKPLLERNDDMMQRFRGRSLKIIHRSNALLAGIRANVRPFLSKGKKTKADAGRRTLTEVAEKLLEAGLGRQW